MGGHARIICEADQAQIDWSRPIFWGYLSALISHKQPILGIKGPGLYISNKELIYKDI